MENLRARNKPYVDQLGLKGLDPSCNIPDDIFKKVKALLIEHEGFKTHPYKDTVGKLTIGIGHNLTDNGLPAYVIEEVFKDDLCASWVAARMIFPDFDGWMEGRKIAILDMIFNLGPVRFGKFKLMIAAIKRGEWIAAAAEALDSEWARQVGGRSVAVARLMEFGK